MKKIASNEKAWFLYCKLKISINLQVTFVNFKLKSFLVGCCIDWGLGSKQDVILFAGAYVLITQNDMLHSPFLSPPIVGPPIFFLFLLIHVIVFDFLFAWFLVWCCDWSIMISSDHNQQQFFNKSYHFSHHSPPPLHVGL